MINPSELRFGNYVIVKNYDSKYWNKIGQVEAFTRNAEYVSLDINQNSAFYLKDIEPIPLTEEILIKCGAYYQSILQDNDLLLIDIDENISIGYCGYLLLVIDGNPIFYGERNKDKLHHLQNLYYQIKGEELTIQL